VNFLDRFPRNDQRIHKYPSSDRVVPYEQRQTDRQTNIRTDRQTDMTKLIVAIRNSPNEPGNEQPLLQSVWYEVAFRLGVCKATNGALMNLRDVR